MIRTLNGEAKVVLMRIKEYEDMQESLAMLRVLEMSRKSMEKDDHEPAEQVFVE